MDNIELLQNSVLFKGCSRESIELLIGMFHERQIKQNATIFAEKMPAEALYIVKSGNVRITLMAGEGEEMGLLLLGPGEFFGELALIQDTNRLVTARAVSPVDLLLLTRKDFHAFLDLDPRTGSKILMTIAKLLAMRVKAYSDKLKELLLS
jgi:CRP/FNR family transcriptional regulator, cyclic AMP receptor protein